MGKLTIILNKTIRRLNIMAHKSWFAIITFFENVYLQAIGVKLPPPQRKAIPVSGDGHRSSLLIIQRLK